MDFIDLKAQQIQIRKKIDKRIKSVLDHGKYIMGPEVFELEEKLASYVNVKHCISCASGTDALLIPLMANNIGPGDAVITTPFTYIATAEVISLLGATPVFVDIYPRTFNINPTKIEHAVEKAMENGLKPKAIIPVDLFGLPARYRLIEEIAKKYNLLVIEDAAQGFGGSIRDVKAGSFGNIASTSFFPAKPLGCYGDGGAIFTNDDELAAIMKSIRIHGSGVDKYENVRIGINGRLDTIQAAILLEKIKIFDDEILLRNKIADFYKKHISSGLTKPHVPGGYISSWAQFSLIANSKKQKDDCMRRLRDNNIPSVIYYRIPLHLQPVFKDLDYKSGAFVNAENCSEHIFSIPMHPYIPREQQQFIVDVINHG
tara:strand:+ start:8 stop:1123 length:1116 start_codon:yes stop_codon:yes gene_type:complete